MSAASTAKGAAGRGAGALVLCGLLGIVIGLMAGLNVARRMTPPATESRLIMQLLDVELRVMDAEARAGNDAGVAHASTTGIWPGVVFAIRACHARGPVWCTDSPVASTATVTGMSCTVNS